MFKNLKIAYRLSGGIILMLTLILVLMLPLVTMQLGKVIDRAETRQLSDLQKSLQARVTDISHEALLVIDSVINQPGVAEAFATQDRERLRELTLPVFSSLRDNYNVRQFQFHLPPATSFLRLHKLEKFGDDLSTFRFTVVNTNNMKKEQYGLEAGVAGIGLRGVVPVSYKGDHIGSAEMGLSFGQDFFDAFTKRYGAQAALHLQENSANGFKTFATTVPGKSSLSKEEFERALKGEQVRKEYSSAGKSFSVLAQPLLDFNKKPLGVAEILVDRDEYLSIYNGTLMRIFVIGGAAFLFGLLLAVLLSNTITKPIINLTEAARVISRGDFSQEIKGADRKDEIGDLARAVARMAESIKLAMNRFRK